MKALVLEKRGERAAVLREDGTYTTTKQPCEIGETIELNAEIVTLRRRRKTWARAAAAAVLALVLLSGSYTYLATSAYAYVSLDSGETSVEVAVNRLGRVISVDAMNEASEETAKALTPELRGKRLEDALPEAMERIRPEEAEGTSDVYLIAGVTSGTEKRREELAETVMRSAEKLDGEKPTVITFEIPPAERREAEETGMSGGRYAFEQRATPPTEGSPRMEANTPNEGTPPEMPELPEQSTPPTQPPQSAPSGEAPEDGQPVGTLDTPPVGETPPESGEPVPADAPTDGKAPPMPGSNGDQAPSKPPQEAPAESPPELPPTGEAPNQPAGETQNPPAGETPPSEAAAAPAGEAPGPMPTAMEHGPEGQLPPSGKQ